MSTKHTPTPWSALGSGVVTENEVIAECLGGTVGFKHNRANAEHIVKCVNHHDELVETLRKVWTDLDFLDPNNPLCDEARALLVKVVL